MDKNKLNHFKNKLLEEKQETLDSLKRMEEGYPNSSMSKYFDELSMYDNHPADLGTEMFMAEQGMNLENVEKLTLSEIEDSLEKIEKGTYGNCDICGKDIVEERLELLPHAKICLDCANEKIPIEKMMDQRPVEEDNLKFPFGRTFKDISDNDEVEFDGEDSWQAVARFNELQGAEANDNTDYQEVIDKRQPGIVEDVEQISEGYYKGQLEGMNREDIPDEQRLDLMEDDDDLE